MLPEVIKKAARVDCNAAIKQIASKPTKIGEAEPRLPINEKISDETLLISNSGRI